MANELLEVSNIETYYGPIMAIRGISFAVPRGAIVTILGANGAGKTTILKTVSGVMDAQKGTVTFEGRPLRGLDPDKVMRLGLSHVPEGREMFPLLTVRENLKMGAFTRRDARRRRPGHEDGVRLLPRARRPRRAAGRLAVGRRAADAGDQPRPHGAAEDDPAGRAVAGALPQARQGDLRYHRPHQPGAGDDHSPRRAEREHGPALGRLRLCAGGRAAS